MVATTTAPDIQTKDYEALLVAHKATVKITTNKTNTLQKQSS